MFRIANSKRLQPKYNRVPPWRRWVESREQVPSVAFTRNEDLSNLIKYPDMNVLQESSLANLEIEEGNLHFLPAIVSKVDSLVSVSDTIDMMTTIVPQFRKFLLASSPLRKQAEDQLDNYCAHLGEVLPCMSLQDKVHLISSFGELREYSVLNRVAPRYNSRKLVYQNSELFSALVKSIDWSDIHLVTRRSVPLLHLTRSVARMDLPRDEMHAVLSSLISAIVTSSLAPKHLAELVLISAKHRLVHPVLFPAVVGELELNFKGFSQDFLGDIVRGFTNMGYANERMYVALNRELQPHQLAWWNLIDILDYYAAASTVLPVDSEQCITRMTNEVWKWIPDMRSGYIAKSVRILAALNLGDERTRRSLIRAIPRGLCKLHPNHVAESIIAAASMDYDPRKKYGRKKFGSLFYRRLAAKLTSNLSNVNGQLMVDVVKALAKIERTNNELFEAILRETKNTAKFSIDQIATIQQILLDKFQITTESKLHQEGCMTSLLFWARKDPNLLTGLLSEREEEMLQVPVEAMIGLLKATKNEALFEFAANNWLLYNLTTISNTEMCMFLQSIITHKPNLKLIATKINKQKCSIELIATYLVMANYDFTDLNQNIFDLIRDQAIDNLRTIQLAQLISAHVRIGNSQVPDPLYRFCSWIDSHLVSRNGPVQSSNHHWFIPPGCVTDLHVFPVMIPLALPDPRVDLRALHGAQNATQVRRILTASSVDCGIALFPHYGSSKDLLTTIREQYLIKLGWTVKYTANLVDVTNSAVVTNALIIADEISHSI